MKLQKETIRKILIITLSNLGDVILTLPVIASLRKAFPKAALYVVVGEKVRELLEGNSLFAETIVYKKDFSLREKIQFILRLRAKKVDFVLDFRNSLIPYLIGRPSKSLWLNAQLRKVQSRYERYILLKKLLLLPDVPPSFFSLYERGDNDSLMQKLHSKGLFNIQNLLLVAPGARLKTKRWPSRYFAALVKTIIEKEDMMVILVGDSFECDVANHVEQLLEGCDVINLCGKTTQKELVILIERARLVLSNDSAVMHLANYFKRPIVAFFGPTSVTKYGTSLPTLRIAQLDLECVPCERSKCVKNRECLEKLTPQAVLPLALELLRNR